jgi:transcription antitermination protein NusB
VTGHDAASGLSRRERIDRVRARSWVLHVLYRWEAEDEGGSLGAALETTLRARRVDPRRLPMIERLVGTLDAHMDDVDGAILGAMENWKLDRLSRIDRSILRMGAAELIYHPDVPGRVAIQEAIRLAGQYGGDESPRFVNGILDAVYRRFRAEG